MTTPFTILAASLGPAFVTIWVAAALFMGGGLVWAGGSRLAGMRTETRKIEAVILGTLAVIGGLLLLGYGLSSLVTFLRSAR